MLNPQKVSIVCSKYDLTLGWGLGAGGVKGLRKKERENSWTGTTTVWCLQGRRGREV